MTVLEQALWRDLQAAKDLRAFGEAWLGLVQRFVPGTVAGALLTHGSGGLALAAAFPAGSPPSAGLVSAARAAAEAGRGVVQPSEEDVTTAFALPIAGLQGPGAVACLDVTLGPGRDARAVMRQLQWAGAWVRAWLLAGATQAAVDGSARVEAAIDLVAATLEQPSAIAATRAAATELAARLPCERVSIGFVPPGRARLGRARLAGISHSAAFGKTMTATRAIEAAMDEAIDQLTLVLVPAPDEAVLVKAAHEHLAGMHRAATVLTVPLLLAGRPMGAVTLERPRDEPFGSADLALVQAVAALLGPLLADKRRADRAIALQAGDWLVRQGASLLGPRYPGRKLMVLAAAAVAAAAWFVRIDYEVFAHARVAGSVQRAIAAPFDGFIREAPVRAGDEVRQGDLLVALDDRDLVLERLRWVTEREVHVAEYDQALGGSKRADAVRLQSQIAQAAAQIRLADEQLARTRLLAPLDGLVVSGDLSQSVGSPVRRGDVLFEVAPLNDWRIELKVPEAQIADIAPDQAGTLIVNALPDQPMPIRLMRVTPVADAEDGRMTFRADAALAGRQVEGLRPGMEGTARIGAGRERAVWVWTRSFRHWLKLAAWSWFP